MWWESFQSSFQPPWFLYSWMRSRGDRRAGEVLDRLRDRLAVRLGDVHQDAIHIEDKSRLAHQISSSAASSGASVRAFRR